MKKYLSLLFILLLVSACQQKEEEKVNEKISSHGELICVYKENRVNENTLYTSYYLFSFNDQGILKDATDQEIIEFTSDTTDELKSKYKKALEESIKIYDDVKGVSVIKKFEDDKYSFIVKMDNNEMDEEIKNDYSLNMDRINTYKTFVARGYTCE